MKCFFFILIILLSSLESHSAVSCSKLLMQGEYEGLPIGVLQIDHSEGARTVLDAVEALNASVDWSWTRATRKDYGIMEPLFKDPEQALLGKQVVGVHLPVAGQVETFMGVVLEIVEGNKAVVRTAPDTEIVVTLGSLSTKVIYTRSLH